MKGVKKAFQIISKIISWVLFVILLVVAAFLLYYYIATRIYAKKGHGYEPKFSIYTIVSQSMTPAIKVYDAIIDVKVNNPDDIKVNDVITFISTSLLTPGKNITHRVIAITKDSDGNACYQTKGDFNNVADDSCAKFNNILGKVVFVIPQLGRVQFFIASKSGLLIFILIPALVVICRDVLKIVGLSKLQDNIDKIGDKPKESEEKKAQEEERKKQLKRKILKDDTEKKEYFKEPTIKNVSVNKTVKESGVNSKQKKKKGKNTKKSKD